MRPGYTTLILKVECKVWPGIMSQKVSRRRVGLQSYGDCIMGCGGIVLINCFKHCSTIIGTYCANLIGKVWMALRDEESFVASAVLP